MNLNNYYWYFVKALSPKICDKIIKHGNKVKDSLAVVGGLSRNRDLKQNPLNKKEIADLKKTRDSNVAWLEDKWIYDEIQPFIHEANKNAGWNFEWDWSEPCQFTKYKLNQHYSWHCDSFAETYNSPHNLNFHNKTRKLSVTCSLSDPKDYKGGELEFQFRNQGDPTITRKCIEILPRGSIVVFPSFVWHRVKPVTKGTRYSLVVWNLGYPFK
jgi:PKHD-type hydroxylase